MDPVACFRRHLEARTDEGIESDEARSAADDYNQWVRRGGFCATVKLVNPVNEDERAARYELVELRGNRVLIRLICDMRIRPTEVVAIGEITL